MFFILSSQGFDSTSLWMVAISFSSINYLIQGRDILKKPAKAVQLPPRRKPRQKQQKSWRQHPVLLGPGIPMYAGLRGFGRPSSAKGDLSRPAVRPQTSGDAIFVRSFIRTACEAPSRRLNGVCGSHGFVAAAFWVQAPNSVQHDPSVTWRTLPRLQDGGYSPPCPSRQGKIQH